MTDAAAPIRLRDLRSLDDCRAVVRLQEAVWGADGETVPASVLLVSAKRGGILIGAEAAGGLVGFVWSMPGVRDDGVRTHWSHMLAVLPGFRRQRLAERLKFAQRERALAQGAEVIEWTFDPLQAANAHFNLHVLGGVGTSYVVDAYGALAGPLHRGTPTDRLIVEWRIRQPQDEPQVAGRQSVASEPTLPARDVAAPDATVAIRTTNEGGWVRVTGTSMPASPRILVPVPPDFLEMQQQATDVALAWRLALRDVMTAAFSSGYRAVDFHLDRRHGGGHYVLARDG